MSSDFECVADYVVVGAGSGGSVVASRLADAGFTVLLLEAGPDTSLESTDPLVQIDLPNIAIPLNFGNLWERFRKYPNSNQCGNWNATQSHLAFVSQNQNGTYYPYPRGTGAGGSASHHAMQDGVGSLQVYDNIAEQIKDDYWKGDNINRLFKKMEKVLYPTEGCAGENGWLSIQHTTKDKVFVDIANEIVSKTGVPFRENFCDPALPYGVGNADVQIKADGTRSYVYQDLLVPINIKTKNIQVHFNTLVSKIILKKKCSKHEHKCKKDSSKKHKKYVAVGVEGYSKAYLQEVEMGRAHSIINDPSNPGECLAVNADNTLPRPMKFLARKEVIVSAGAIQTPQLLMNSGIGPSDHLTTVGIKTKVDLPGVGTGLLDHCEVPQVFELDASKYLPSWQAQILKSLYFENFYAPGKPFETYYNNVIAPSIAGNPDFLNQNTACIVWDWWSSGQVEVVPGEQYPFPDVHCIPYPLYLLYLDTTGSLQGLNYPGSYFNFYKDPWRPNPLNPFAQEPPGALTDKFDIVNSQFAPAPEVGLKTFMSFLTENLKPRTVTGTVRLQSSDPRITPIIEENLFDDTEGLRQMAKMMLQIREIMSSPSLLAQYGFGNPVGTAYGSGLIPAGEPIPTDYQPGPLAATEDQLIEYIKTWSAYGHHISGNCRMGAVDRCGRAVDDLTVLDPRCRVLGVKNLRIADTSVYPTPWLHAYNTSRAGYVVGEAVSEFIINKL